jgi:hypothetical protein
VTDLKTTTIEKKKDKLIKKIKKKFGVEGADTIDEEEDDNEVEEDEK